MLTSPYQDEGSVEVPGEYKGLEVQQQGLQRVPDVQLHGAVHGVTEVGHHPAPDVHNQRLCN